LPVVDPWKSRPDDKTCSSCVEAADDRAFDAVLDSHAGSGFYRFSVYGIEPGWATFTSNAISIVLLVWPMMFLAMSRLQWWPF